MPALVIAKRFATLVQSVTVWSAISIALCAFPSPSPVTHKLHEIVKLLISCWLQPLHTPSKDSLADGFSFPGNSS